MFIHVSGKNCRVRLETMVQECIGQTKAKIYLNFIVDMICFTIALRAKGARAQPTMVTKCLHVKDKVIHNWKDGTE